MKRNLQNIFEDGSINYVLILDLNITKNVNENC